MAVYEEILDWAQGKQIFIQDALRRIITSTELTQNDIDELVLLVKKECGDTSITINALPINRTHIPTTVSVNGDYPRLISLSNPINICALHEQASLQFSKTGLTVIYGNNGSGKSSYSRIFRKLCWSRNPSVILKKNVFRLSRTPQQVNFVLEINGINNSFTWNENSQKNTLLNSIYVFDNDCGETYINNENPTEYKPIGIDVLEKLISILGRISQTLELSISQFNTQKPVMLQNMHQTNSAQWYKSIETLQLADVESRIQFFNTDVERKQQLTNLLASQNPQQNITNLIAKRKRIINYIQQLSLIEVLFNEQNIKELRINRNQFEIIEQANIIAINELNSVNTLNGFGTDPWRTLWEAAKKYAEKSKLTDGNNFPSSISLEKCVLCQQELDESAKKRMASFNDYVLNDVSTQLSSINETIQNKINIYNSIVVPSYEYFTELEQFLPELREDYGLFASSVDIFKNLIISFLKSGGNLDINLLTLTPRIMSILPSIDSEINMNNLLVQDRNALIAELNELTVKEFLFNNKVIILQYFNEYKYKQWIKNCQMQLATNTISRKIGELMDTQAVNLQHQEFISHLSSFNRDLASKVRISKTKTSQGSTYQRCGFYSINDPINSIMSEGEQKIIALSNFLAECTIDNRLNTIIFDDPVTSLDTNYRDLIAQKIVQLSENRQIVVFTHDLSFLRLLIDTHNTFILTDCNVICIDKYNEISGIVTDEIPYLVKNVQERIDSIKRILREYDSLELNDAHGREIKLDSARKRFRMLLERSVEEILSNKTYERFNKNIHLKKGNLSSYIVTERADIDFLLNLFSRYSITEHDGGTSTISQLPSKIEIEQDIRSFTTWKEDFKRKLYAFSATYR
ncbi:AAA family ATPase [Clostridium boliviensis]|uniref:AAA family ATPase n=1 Tax=Clostridium boliviensis TaxID=318465 RepID=A0ABU4GRF2_9CLOT|nr:AAA family ATPase [Clostridium boliviensis]MDW2798777.1 AAA family ATPase [Clostridium boliviensis]